MMKVGWELITNKDALWAHVIRSTYDCGSDLLHNIRMGVHGSRIWSGIKNTWKDVLAGVEVVQRNGEHRARWKLERSGQFTVKSAYSYIAEDDSVQVGRWWKDMWKVPIPQRRKTHMWLVLHDRLLTNDALHERHIHRDGSCVVCPSIKENTIHVLIRIVIELK